MCICSLASLANHGVSMSNQSWLFVLHPALLQVQLHSTIANTQPEGSDRNKGLGECDRHHWQTPPVMRYFSSCMGLAQGTSTAITQPALLPAMCRQLVAGEVVLMPRGYHQASSTAAFHDHNIIIIQQHSTWQTLGGVLVIAAT